MAKTAAQAPRGVFVEKPRANIYTALMVLSFAALVMGCVFLGLEMKTYYDWDSKATAVKTPG